MKPWHHKLDVVDSHWYKFTQANTSHGLAHDQTVVFGPDNLKSLVGIQSSSINIYMYIYLSEVDKTILRE